MHLDCPASGPLWQPLLTLERGQTVGLNFTPPFLGMDQVTHHPVCYEKPKYALRDHASETEIAAEVTINQTLFYKRQQVLA